MKIWNEAELLRHITDEIEESLTLDYKASDALARSDGKKIEVTKDVSAMANADGGVIVYGLKEHPEKRHLVEKFDPIDRRQFTKEWLDQIISTIRPYIDTVIVHPVSLSTGDNDVAYVVEIPKGHTAHQARDLRYYRRHNFESVAMQDYEVRDVMNRASVAEASVSFAFKRQASAGRDITYLLQPFIQNSGEFVIKDFKLTITFPRLVARGARILPRLPNINISVDENKDFFIEYQSSRVLFPKEKRNIGDELQWTYEINDAIRRELDAEEQKGWTLVLNWTLYADNMPAKHGTYPIQKLHER